MLDPSKADPKEWAKQMPTLAAIQFFRQNEVMEWDAFADIIDRHVVFRPIKYRNDLNISPSELIRDIAKRRVNHTCAIERIQPLCQRIKVPTAEKGRFKEELVRTGIQKVRHINDREDRDICTNCGNQMLTGKVNREEKMLIVVPKARGSPISIEEKKEEGVKEQE
jgi:hypothetical protein